MNQAFSRYMSFITVILMDILGGAEVDLFVPSFPELQCEFGLSTFWIETSLSINFLGFCLSLLFIGNLADNYGRKPVIIPSLIIFIFGCILCMWATSYEIILLGRFLQGIGIAAPSTLCFLIIADAYPIKKQQYLMAILNGFLNISIAVAPIIGSYLTLYFHWQGNFMALLVLGWITLTMTMLFIPSDRHPKQNKVIPLQEYKLIFKSKPLMLLITNITFIFVPYWIFVGISPVLYMEDLGVNLSQFGYYQGALAFVFALGSIIAGQIIKNFDSRKMLYISNIICIAGLIIFALVAYLNLPYPLLITLSFLPFIVGTIIPCTIIYPFCLNFLPQSKGRVSAIIEGARLIISALCLQIVGYIYINSFQNIGIVISIIIIIAIITLFFAIKNNKLKGML